jgi:hypothetical protein
MGEYVRHLGSTVKLGTCEDLYYVSYPKYKEALQNSYLFSVENNCAVAYYAKPDSGFRFRFPFPDEDRLSFGDIGKHDIRRGVAITLDANVIELRHTDNKVDKRYQIEIVQQKLVNRQEDGKLCLALVWRDPVRGKNFREEEDATVRKILSQIIKHHVLHEQDIEKKIFFRSIACRILKGYRLETPNQEIKKEEKQHPYLKPTVNKSNKKLKR